MRFVKPGKKIGPNKNDIKVVVADCDPVTVIATAILCELIGFLLELL